MASFALVACGETEETTAADPTESATSAAPAPEVIVEDGWVRATVGTDDTTMTAAFMSITNPTDADVTLSGAATDVAGMVQLHEMTMDSEGKMVMQQIEGGLVVPAGGHQHLEPGGNHIMLIDMQGELAPGDEVALTLMFSDGSTMDLTLPVKEFTEEEPHYHESGDAEMEMSESPSS
ncbi:MAG: copper chaperone PCu(A)C [Nocardioides sp.]